MVEVTGILAESKNDSHGGHEAVPVIFPPETGSGSANAKIEDGEKSDLLSADSTEPPSCENQAPELDDVGSTIGVLTSTSDAAAKYQKADGFSSRSNGVSIEKDRDDEADHDKGSVKMLSTKFFETGESALWVPSQVISLNGEAESSTSVSSSVKDTLSKIELLACHPKNKYIFLQLRRTVFIGKARRRSKKKSQAFEYCSANDPHWKDRITHYFLEEQLFHNGAGKLKSCRGSHSRKRFSSGDDCSPSADERRKQEASPAELMVIFRDTNCVIPSEIRLNKIFRHFGYLLESETQVDHASRCARVIFKRGFDAQVACDSCEKVKVFEGAAVSYHVGYSPLISVKKSPTALPRLRDDGNVIPERLSECDNVENTEPTTEFKACEGSSNKRIKQCKESELATEPNTIVLNSSGGDTQDHDLNNSECNDDEDKEPITEFKACDEDKEPTTEFKACDEGLSNKRIKRCKESELATEPNTIDSSPSDGDTHDHDVNNSGESLPETVTAVEKLSYRPLSAYGMLSDAEFDDALDIIRSKISEERSEAFAFVHSLYFGAWCRKKNSETIMKRILQLGIFIRKKYVFIPVAASSHWWLIILCNPAIKQERCVILLDSLGSGNAGFNEASVRKFMNSLFTSSNPSEPAAAYRRMPIYKPIVPKQEGRTECGIYVLYYIYLFVQCAPDQFELKDYPYFMKVDWFSKWDVMKFAEGIQIPMC